MGEQRWIPVGERLPDLYLSVLVFSDFRPAGGSRMKVDCRSSHGFDEERITHWMPLPEPPDVPPTTEPKT